MRPKGDARESARQSHNVSGIRDTVVSSYVPEHSKPAEGEWFDARIALLELSQPMIVN